MKTFFKTLLVLIVIGLAVLWKTGNLCDLYIQTSLDNFAYSHGGQSMAILSEKEAELKDLLIPHVCSVDQFDTVFKNWYENFLNHAQEIERQRQ